MMGKYYPLEKYLNDMEIELISGEPLDEKEAKKIEEELKKKRKKKLKNGTFYREIQKD